MDWARAACLSYEGRPVAAVGDSSAVAEAGFGDRDLIDWTYSGSFATKTHSLPCSFTIRISVDVVLLLRGPLRTTLNVFLQDGQMISAPSLQYSMASFVEVTV